MNERSQQELKAAFATRLETLSPAREARLITFDYKARTTRRRRLWAAVGATGSAVTAGIVATGLLLSSGATIAYAGWTAVPSTVSQASIISTGNTCAHAFVGGTETVAHDQAFTQPPVLAETRGIYTALVTVSNGRLYSCLIGGRLNDPNPSFHLNIADYGRVGSAPSAGLISAPYTRRGEIGEGRGMPNEIAGYANANPAQQIAVRARLQGGGYGPNVLGQAGPDVKAVSFRLANGDTVAATVQNGWYFAWWPWISEAASKLASVTVATSSQTTTSPMTSLDPPRDVVTPQCRPGSDNCVFANTAPTS